MLRVTSFEAPAALRTDQLLSWMRAVYLPRVADLQGAFDDVRSLVEQAAVRDRAWSVIGDGLLARICELWRETINRIPRLTDVRPDSDSALVTLANFRATAGTVLAEERARLGSCTSAILDARLDAWRAYCAHRLVDVPRPAPALALPSDWSAPLECAAAPLTPPAVALGADVAVVRTDGALLSPPEWDTLLESVGARLRRMLRARVLDGSEVTLATEAARAGHLRDRACTRVDPVRVLYAVHQGLSLARVSTPCVASRGIAFTDCSLRVDFIDAQTGAAVTTGARSLEVRLPVRTAPTLAVSLASVDRLAPAAPVPFAGSPTGAYGGDAGAWSSPTPGFALDVLGQVGFASATRVLLAIDDAQRARLEACGDVESPTQIVVLMDVGGDGAVRGVWPETSSVSTAGECVAGVAGSWRFEAATSVPSRRVRLAATWSHARDTMVTSASGPNVDPWLNVQETLAERRIERLFASCTEIAATRGLPRAVTARARVHLSPTGEVTGATAVPVDAGSAEPIVRGCIEAVLGRTHWTCPTLNTGTDVDFTVCATARQPGRAVSAAAPP